MAPACRFKSCGSRRRSSCSACHIKCAESQRCAHVPSLYFCSFSHSTPWIVHEDKRFVCFHCFSTGCKGKRKLADLLLKVLQELKRDAREDERYMAQQLDHLEHERIAQAAAAGRLFRDRSTMIEDEAISAHRRQQRMLKEQQQVLRSLPHPASTNP